MSQKMVEMHWGEYQHAYVEGLNKQLEKNDILYGCTMDELVKVTYNNENPLSEFNNAAQVWNHDFFWESMQPGSGDMRKLGLLQQIEKDFGSFLDFRKRFIEAALSLFGSGWVWLVYVPEMFSCDPSPANSDGGGLSFSSEMTKEEARSGENVECYYPPTLAHDVWEHAYYLDYKNDKARYVNLFMDHLVSWNVVTGRMIRAEAFVNLSEPTIPVA